ncbi:MAG: hypothetical protein AB1630_12795, partial [bacterium]
KEFMTISGYTSSTLEHNIWEKWYGEGAISAIKAIQIANESNIPIYDIDASNVSMIDTFNIPDLAKQDIKNAINAGNIAKCPQSSITYNGWQGIGYIIQDPITGEARYEIADVSGGIILILAPSAKSLDDFYDIQMKAINYAHDHLTNNVGDPIPNDCEAFAIFAQKLASLWDEYEGIETSIKKLFFLHSLYDLSVSNKWYYWQFGLLGWSGPRILRPLWLNTHYEGKWWHEGNTITIMTGGYKIYDYDELYNPKLLEEAVSGKKDHFVSNALSVSGATFIVYELAIIGALVLEGSENDMAYNALGGKFGNGIMDDTIPFSGVEDWIMKYLHGPLYYWFNK